MVPHFGLTHDDAVCPGKRVVSWINVCNFYRATSWPYRAEETQTGFPEHEIYRYCGTFNAALREKEALREGHQLRSCEQSGAQRWATQRPARRGCVLLEN
jgi:hypothetical protein